ncbi:MULTISPECIES: hypothetical protein [unclassified Crossiella]|uniref:hypothetical protein n=1 Tax=unclassified Crossiella TaxID=2620835 RepID=UPI001FFE6439|nr:MULTISPECIES: hypothetical protein [unclassified Crossiella]MCK2239755.1 hypothetical protein [Crossiella sp. S99.2]MCK2252450.1 hypothetical protein [Crossiella sp. S99.1]
MKNLLWENSMSMRSCMYTPILLCSAAMLTGCGTHELHQATPLPSATSTSAVSPASSGSAVADVPGVGSNAARLAIDAYRGMWHEFTVAAATSNHYSNGLALYTSAPALTDIRGLLYADSIAGLITLGLPVTAPRVKAVRVPEFPVEVDIVDCVDVSRWRKYKARGGVADSSPDRRIVDVTVRNNDDRWKVTAILIREARSC